MTAQEHFFCVRLYRHGQLIQTIDCQSDDEAIALYRDFVNVGTGFDEVELVCKQKILKG